MNKDTERFVTLKTFTYPNQASIIMGRLEAEGIQCFLKDQFAVQVNPFYSNAIGGVKLQVLESDFAKAQEVMALNEADYVNLNDDTSTENITIHETENQKQGVLCPFCGSSAVLKQKYSIPFVAVSIILLGFPLLLKRKKYHCFTCDADFEEQ